MRNSSLVLRLIAAGLTAATRSYAHVLALVGQRFLLVLGGNDGYKVRATLLWQSLARSSKLTVKSAAVGCVGTRHGCQALQMAERSG